MKSDSPKHPPSFVRDFLYSVRGKMEGKPPINYEFNQVPFNVWWKYKGYKISFYVPFFNTGRSVF